MLGVLHRQWALNVWGWCLWSPCLHMRKLSNYMAALAATQPIYYVEPTG